MFICSLSLAGCLISYVAFVSFYYFSTVALFFSLICLCLCFSSVQSTVCESKSLILLFFLFFFVLFFFLPSFQLQDQFHHIVWMGDLNYRLALKSATEALRLMSVGKQAVLERLVRRGAEAVAVVFCFRDYPFRPLFYTITKLDSLFVFFIRMKIKFGKTGFCDCVAILLFLFLFIIFFPPFAFAFNCYLFVFWPFRCCVLYIFWCFGFVSSPSCFG